MKTNVSNVQTKRTHSPPSTHDSGISNQNLSPGAVTKEKKMKRKISEGFQLSIPIPL